MFKNEVNSILKDFQKKVKKLNALVEKIEARNTEIDNQVESLYIERNDNVAVRDRAKNVADKISQLTES